MTKNNVLLLAALTSIINPTISFAQDEPESRAQYSLGLRVWSASWATALPSTQAGFGPTLPPAPVLGEALDFVDGRHKTTVIPSLSMRKDKFLLSASHARYSSDFFTSNAVIPTNISGAPNIVTSRSDHVTRKESDVTAGYFLVPNVAVSLGFKYATEDRTISFAGAPPAPFVDNTVRVILLGASAAFPIYDKLSLTGQLAYGPGRAKTRYLNQAISPDTNNTRYAISELGVSYALGMESAYFRGASIGLGYRSQVVRTKGTGPARDSRRIYRDEREGIVASLNIAI